MCKKRLFVALCLLFLPHLVLAEEPLMNLSSTIREKLLLQRQELMSVQNELVSVQNDLVAAQEELMKSSSSLMSINEELMISYSRITILEKEAKQKTKVLLVLLLIVFIRTVCMLIGYILYIKGIKLPRWLDILL